MVDVFKGFEARLDIIEKDVSLVEDDIRQSKNYCCRHVTTLARDIKDIEEISSSVMTIASILDMSGSENTVTVINKCKGLLERVHDACRIAYLKDECETYSRVSVSKDMRDCVSKYSKAEVSGIFVLEGNGLVVEISEGLSGLEISVIAGGESV